MNHQRKNLLSDCVFLFNGRDDDDKVKKVAEISLLLVLKVASAV